MMASRNTSACGPQGRGPRHAGEFGDHQRDGGSESGEQMKLFAGGTQGDDITEDRMRGRANIVAAWQWIWDNQGTGGAWEFVKLWLDGAAEHDKTTSLRCCLDSLAEAKEDFTDSSGRAPSTSHKLSGALSRIVLALNPQYESILEQRPSKLLDGFGRDEVLALCPFGSDTIA